MIYANLERVVSAYITKAKALGGGECWIVKALSSDAPFWQGHVRKWDTIIGNMPSSEVTKLVGKFNGIIPSRNPKTTIDEYDGKFLDIIVEILGWHWLSQRYPSATVRICEPDLTVVDHRDDVIAEMACKNFRRSDKDREYLDATMISLDNIKARPVDTNLVSADDSINPFLRKLRGKRDTAEGQVTKAERRNKKFIFINFELDMSADLQEKGVIHLIRDEGAALWRKGIELVAFKDYDPERLLVNSDNSEPSQ